jgi:hypothetical protein
VEVSIKSPIHVKAKQEEQDDANGDDDVRGARDKKRFAGANDLRVRLTNLDVNSTTGGGSAQEQAVAVRCGTLSVERCPPAPLAATGGGTMAEAASWMAMLKLAAITTDGDAAARPAPALVLQLKQPGATTAAAAAPHLKLHVTGMRLHGGLQVGVCLERRVRAYLISRMEPCSDAVEDQAADQVVQGLTRNTWCLSALKGSRILCERLSFYTFAVSSERRDSLLGAGGNVVGRSSAAGAHRAAPVRGPLACDGIRRTYTWMVAAVGPAQEAVGAVGAVADGNSGREAGGLGAELGGHISSRSGSGGGPAAASGRCGHARDGVVGARDSGARQGARRLTF